MSERSPRVVTLPIFDMSANGNGKQSLEAAGAKFGEVVPDEPILQYVELPQGWKKIDNDHAPSSSLIDDKWYKRVYKFFAELFHNSDAPASFLVDDKGRKRVSIFFIEGLYNSGGFYLVYRRYTIVLQDNKNITAHVLDKADRDSPIFTTKAIADDEKSYEELDWEAASTAKDWLDEHFPDWKDPSAYWE